MNDTPREREALLFVGSPKGLKSTSHALGSYLLKKLEAGGLATKTLVVGAALHSDQNLAAMQKAAATADLIVFSFPLYVDQLPAPLIQALELIAEERKAHSPAKPQKIMAIVQCGFPETHQNRTACDILEQFAKGAGFEWAGALAMGMGGAVGGRSLKKAAGMVRNTVKALDLAAASLLAGGNVPQEAGELIGRPLISKRLYVFMANFGWRGQIKKHRARKLVYARPYES
ncbi:MAG TPA: NAD(P)H-dependent oxidoreductase [Terriglobales bacterium]|nr:NAD(P)H-dependent oxidoreductase [Terriglobales bacterium]